MIAVIVIIASEKAYPIYIITSIYFLHSKINTYIYQVPLISSYYLLNYTSKRLSDTCYITAEADDVRIGEVEPKIGIPFTCFNMFY